MSKASAERRNRLPATRVSQVLFAVGNEHLDLVQGKGYWYFVYDDTIKGIYDTTSIMTMRLGDFTVAQWAEDGREFCAKMEKQANDTTRHTV
jgi:hypothetical protein